MHVLTELIHFGFARWHKVAQRRKMKDVFTLGIPASLRILFPASAGRNKPCKTEEIGYLCGVAKKIGHL
jgi:hypothetical protein